jgi:hypothetical protein
VRRRRKGPDAFLREVRMGGMKGEPRPHRQIYSATGGSGRCAWELPVGIPWEFHDLGNFLTDRPPGLILQFSYL